MPDVQAVKNLFPVPEILQRMYRFYGKALGVMAETIVDYADNVPVVNALQDKMHDAIDMISTSMRRWNKEGMEMNAGLHPEVEAAHRATIDGISSYLDSVLLAESRELMAELHEFDPTMFIDPRISEAQAGKDSTDVPNLNAQIDAFIAQVLNDPELQQEIEAIVEAAAEHDTENDEVDPE